eukprot:TRINITY_DN20529_c0_g1_i1.p1 TRINITY_DN20529_c0_g1~~TRINITY_DN20529_c0_g1_i1.p1  ORF type:complete len:1001 (-),score=225.18 TRINITY_DN20529_c0_g1_i1:66-2657(-)
MGICRACIVDGCEVCTSKGEDTCAKCQSGYTLKDGMCENNNKYKWYAVFAVVGFMFLFFCAYMAELFFLRARVNEEGLTQALAARSQAKPRQPKDANGERHLWPLLTNLMKEPHVCGVGLQLQFNFQTAIIVWAFAVAVAWALLAYFVDDALFILGTRRAITARQNCILVAWGFETQQRLMWTKIDFMVGLYIVTFLLCMAFGIRQLRLFQQVDQAHSTHKDFAARIRNLPLLDGEEDVEVALKKAIEQATEQEVVGVSVCWDFAEHEDDLMGLVESDLREKELAANPPPAPVVGQEPEEPQSWFAKMECTYLPDLAGGADKIVAKGKMTEEEKTQAEEASGESDEIAEVKEVDVSTILKQLKTCPDAYAVFRTEQSRDKAVENASQLNHGGISFKGNTITLNASRVEPQSVKWPNCSNTDLWFKAKRILTGLGVIGTGLAVWVVCFYLPYAWFSLTFNYSYGREPGFAAGMTFSMIVVAGNLLMYQVCSLTAENARFIYVDDKEVCYMLCYCFACVFNVVLDLVCTYMVAYRINVGLRMKTYDGTLLQNVQAFSARFETYAMQRTLANNLYAYAFPATFLIGFLIEPVATYYVPYKVIGKIISSQPSIKGLVAEKLLPVAIIGTEMDLSRYADILLNVMIAVLIFFFPGGFNISMFMALGLCHILIYAIDHYRVIRCITAVHYADKMVDWWAQWLLSIPVACMLSCFVFKANCQPGYFCLDDQQTIEACAAAFFFHIVLHTLCLKFLVPKFGLTAPSDDAEVDYKSVSERLACSWFTSNPIYCLRSQYFYQHDPPCTYYLPGKEHLMQVHEEIGLYFKDAPAPSEDYNAPHVTLDDIQSGVEDIKLHFSPKAASDKEDDTQK